LPPSAWPKKLQKSENSLTSSKWSTIKSPEPDPHGTLKQSPNDSKTTLAIASQETTELQVVQDQLKMELTPCAKNSLDATNVSPLTTESPLSPPNGMPTSENTDGPLMPTVT